MEKALSFDPDKPLEPPLISRQDNPFWRRTCRTLSGLVLLSLLFVLLMRMMGYGDAQNLKFSVFFHLFAKHELAGLGLLLAFLLLAGPWVIRGQLGFLESMIQRTTKWLHPWMLGLGVLIVCWAGTFIVYHNFPLSLDEYCAVFQSELFAIGKVTKTLEAPWVLYNWYLTPALVTYDAAKEVWVANYLPGYALIRSLFVRLGSASLLNPLLGCLSILLVASVAQKLFPNKKNYPLLAAVILGTNTSFLLMSMSLYSWPSHLCLNLLWLYLYSRQDIWGDSCLPWVGMVAVLQHQPFGHLLFVAPFLWRVLLSGRLYYCLYLGLVYLVALIGTLYWWGAISFPGAVSEGVGLFQCVSWVTFFTQAAYFILFLGWAGPLMLILGGEALRSKFPGWRHLLGGLFVAKKKSFNESFFDDLWLGILLTVFFYFLIPFNQGHGWGYRYIYPVLGSITLLCVQGWGVLVERGFVNSLKIWAALAVAYSWIILLPIRCLQAESYIRPYAKTMEYIQSQSSDIVILKTDGVWYSWDLIRNQSPARERPLVMNGMFLSERMEGLLASRYDVKILNREELLRLGIPACKKRNDADR